MIDTWNPAKLNEKISGSDSWNSAILNEAVIDRDSWNPAILNESAGDTPVEFEATITVTFPEGATVTCSDGTTTLTADDNPMAFSIPNEGTWALSCSANGLTLTGSVVITTNGQTETVDLTPVGETVIPTDSVPMLIACAGIGDSTYTTISDVIADSDLLEEITTNDNTIAYLVRSTTFAATMVADEDTMAAIGASNGCSDALLSDSTWLTAICNSTYFESVLNVKVPVMTSDTTPSGECFADELYSVSEYAYKSFDNNTSTTTAFKRNRNNDYLGYKFSSPQIIKSIMIDANVVYSDQATTGTITVQGSSDGTNYSNIFDKTISQTSYVSKDSFVNSTSYQYIRVDFAISNPNASTGLYVRELQFYGRVDV